MLSIPDEISLITHKSEHHSLAAFGFLPPKELKLSASARTMYVVLLQKTIERMRCDGASMAQTYSFCVPVSEILPPEVAQSHKKGIAMAKMLLREICFTQMQWSAPHGTREGVLWMSMNLLAHAELILKEDGVTWADWSFCPSMTKALLSPGFVIPNENAQYGDLKNNASIVLHEICAPCLAHPDGATLKQSTQWWISALSNYALKIDPETQQVKLRDWRKFKSEKVNPAIHEIAEKTDLLITMKEFKIGKKVVEVQFFVRKKVSVSDAFKASVEITPAFTEQENNLAPLNPPFDAVGPVAADVKKPQVGEDDVKEVSAALGAAPEPPAYQPPAENRFLLCAPPSKSWHEMRHMEITAELMALPPDVQTIYVEKATASLRSGNILTANLARKLKTGEWKGGFLFNKVLDVYLRENYPADWDIESEA